MRGVHDPARRPGHHQDGAGDAAEPREEIAGTVAFEGQHRAVEAEGPVPGPALDDRMMGEIGHDRGADGDLVGHEAEGSERLVAGRVAPTHAHARHPGVPPGRLLSSHPIHAAVEQHEAAHTLGVRRRVPGRDATTHRVADEHHAAGCQRVLDRGQIAREVLEAVPRRLRPVALAVAAQVGRDEPPSRDEGGDERGWFVYVVPPVRVAAVAVEEQRRRVGLTPPHEAAEREPAGRHPDGRGHEPSRHGGGPRPPFHDQVQSSRKRAMARGTTDS